MILNEFKNNISKVINEAQLPIDVIYYVMKDIVNEIATLYNNELQKEAIEKQQQEQKNKEENTTEEK